MMNQFDDMAQKKRDGEEMARIVKTLPKEVQFGLCGMVAGMKIAVDLQAMLENKETA